MRIESLTKSRVEWAERCLLLFFLARLMAVDISGVVTNDSVGYLTASQNPLANGFITQGYRQAAYPIWIHFCNYISNIFGWDIIFGVAMMQRLIFAFGVVLIWRALRWWSIPLLFVATSASLVAHVDFILTEGLLISLSLLLVGLLLTLISKENRSIKNYRSLFTLIVFVVAVMSSIKLQYGALFLVAFSGAVTKPMYPKKVNMSSLYALSIGVLLIGLLALFQGFENKEELGVFTPVGEHARAEWYGAWQSVFKASPENQDVIELQEYFSDGNLYVFLHGIEKEVPKYLEREILIKQRIDEMFRIVGTSRSEQFLLAFRGALEGGRTDDLAGLVSRDLRAEPYTPELRYTGNSVARNDGVDELLLRVNDGKVPEIISLEALFHPFQRVGLSDFRTKKAMINMLSIFILLGSVFVSGRHRYFAIGSLLSGGLIATLLATAYIDNARYLVVSMILYMAGATYVLREIYKRAPVVENEEEYDKKSNPC